MLFLDIIEDQKKFIKMEENYLKKKFTFFRGFQYQMFTIFNFGEPKNDIDEITEIPLDAEMVSMGRYEEDLAVVVEILGDDIAKLINFPALKHDFVIYVFQDPQDPEKYYCLRSEIDDKGIVNKLNDKDKI